MNIIGGARKHWDIIICGHYYFSDKQQFIHTFPYKMADFQISELLGFFWMYLVKLKVGRKKLVKTLGVFPTTTETKSEQY